MEVFSEPDSELTCCTSVSLAHKLPSQFTTASVMCPSLTPTAISDKHWTCVSPGQTTTRTALPYLPSAPINPAVCTISSLYTSSPPATRKTFSAHKSSHNSFPARSGAAQISTSGRQCVFTAIIVFKPIVSFHALTQKQEKDVPFFVLGLIATTPLSFLPPWVSVDGNAVMPFLGACICVSSASDRFPPADPPPTMMPLYRLSVSR